MRRATQLMMQCIVALGIALVCTIGRPGGALAAEVTTVAGNVTWVSRDVVEVAGRRGLITDATSITSDGRAISIASIVVGMPAELEIDAGGRALELRVKGAVE